MLTYPSTPLWRVHVEALREELREPTARGIGCFHHLPEQSDNESMYELARLRELCDNNSRQTYVNATTSHVHPAQYWRSWELRSISAYLQIIHLTPLSDSIPLLNVSMSTAERKVSM